jgi:hypothetical protein
VFDFDAVDQMESSEEEDMSRGDHINKGPIEKSMWAPRSKQRKVGMDIVMRAAMATDGQKVMKDDQQEPATIDARKVITTRAAQKIQAELEKKRLAVDILANAESTRECPLLCCQVGE